MTIDCFLICRVVWSATYTYILLLFVAAAFIAYIARPRAHGEAVKRLFAGTLLPVSEAESGSIQPRIHIHCLEGGKVVFERLGVENLTATGAVSLAVTFKGKDVEIVERLTNGYPNDCPMGGATFTIDMTGYEWRHVRWINEDNGLWCSFTLHVRPDIDFTLPLKL